VIFDGTNKSGLTWVRVSKNPDRARDERDPLNLTGLAGADVADENFLVFAKSSCFFASSFNRTQEEACLLLEQLLQRFDIRYQAATGL
jgi:hypothetical protein